MLSSVNVLVSKGKKQMSTLLWSRTEAISAFKQWEHRRAKRTGIDKIIVSFHHIEGQIGNFTVDFSFSFMNCCQGSILIELKTSSEREDCVLCHFSRGGKPPVSGLLSDLWVKLHLECIYNVLVQQETTTAEHINNIWWGRSCHLQYPIW